MVGWLQGGEIMKDLLVLLGVVAIWYLVNRFILPRLGIQT
jgi:hypothetical protein